MVLVWVDELVKIARNRSHGMVGRCDAEVFKLGNSRRKNRGLYLACGFSSVSMESRRRSFANTISRATYPSENRRMAKPNEPTKASGRYCSTVPRLVYSTSSAKMSVPAARTRVIRYHQEPGEFWNQND